MLKKLVALAVLLLAVAGGFAAWRYFHSPTVALDTLVLYGNVDIRQVSLAFNGSDRIVALNAQEGDRVGAGQVLGRLDSRAIELRAAQIKAKLEAQQQALALLEAGSRPEEIERAEAAVVSAQAETELARKQFERLQAIRQTAAPISQQDLDTAQTRRKVAQAQLESARKAHQLLVAGPRKEEIAQARAQLAGARAELASTDYQLQETTLKAPIAAVVRARLLEPGEMASPQRPVFTLAITAPKWVRAYVTEPDLGRIRPGMAAGVTTDSHPAAALPGRVGYISSVAEFTPKTVQTEELRTSLVYEVRILVEDATDRLRLGMPATVRIPLDQAAGSANSALPAR
ncbi:MAG: HlyD family efflux transporter periplasmic adaptor subunit [Candidatus Competibacteraceae bacterium]|nr:HlyD family efflux transporter periplasmic adaptor subunit [Candidatus Competibacteraceae bacterium]MBK8896124.1 HlyD family efflux transporter periplasmic adaptor subunit [Candidatus Competibacteraceae bacterium]